MTPPSNFCENDAARDRFEAGVASMREGTKLYLTNDFRSAEALFRRGAAGDDDGNSSVNVDGKPGGNESISGTGATAGEVVDHGPDGPDAETEAEASIDLRGAFALQYAIVGLLRGVASMEDDQLDTSLDRLWDADALAARDAPWVGRKVVRGMCQLVAGIVECLRKRPAQGVYHMAGSWLHLRALRTEALDYQGLGREVVRSSALLGLGAFALVLSLLPDSLVRAASWATGFEIDRAAGMEMLRTCQREGGVYAPIGALGWVAFTIDTKAFLGEEQSEAELDECEGLFKWAEDRFPHSLFFGILEADFHATRRKLPEALDVLDRAMLQPCLVELRALKAVLSYKKAIYHLAALDWIEAAKSFQLSQAIYKAAGRRSLGPTMAMYAAHCFCIDGGDGCEDAVRRMMDEVAIYKAMDKSNWKRPDRMAFRAHAEYENDCNCNPNFNWSLLNIVTAMAITMRCTLWMNSDTVDKLISLLDGAGYEENPDDAAMAEVCISQIHIHQGSIDAGLARCTKALRDLSPLVGETSQTFGTLPMLHYLEAHLYCAAGALLRAEASNRLSVETTKSDMDLGHYLSFKTSQLGRIVKKRMEETYIRVDLPAGKIAVINIDIDLSTRNSCRPHGDAGAATGVGVGHDVNGGRDANTTGTIIRWDWKLEARDVDFHVCFLPQQEEEEEDQQAQDEIEVVPNMRHSAVSGPVEGVFCTPDDCKGGGGSGSLKFCFSNKHSYLRGKVVTYKLSLPPNATVSSCELM